MKKIGQQVSGLILILLVITGCYGRFDLKSKTLPTAVKGSNYQYEFVIDEEGLSFLDDYYAVLQDGNLPDGMGITYDGYLIGSPEETGSFHFRVQIGDVADSEEENESFADSEWYTLFVTEASTNSNCPQPDEENVSEIYVCLGAVEESGLAAGDSFILDLNLYINPDKLKSYALKKLVISIAYDPAQFSVDNDTLNSSVLREAATHTSTGIDFDSTTSGVLKVTLTSEKFFSRSGRYADLPFVLATDLADGDYNFSLSIESLSSSKDNVDLPDLIDEDGLLTLSSS